MTPVEPRYLPLPTISRTQYLPFSTIMSDNNTNVNSSEEVQNSGSTIISTTTQPKPRRCKHKPKPQPEAGSSKPKGEIIYECPTYPRLYQKTGKNPVQYFVFGFALSIHDIRGWAAKQIVGTAIAPSAFITRQLIGAKLETVLGYKCYFAGVRLPGKTIHEDSYSFCLVITTNENEQNRELCKDVARIQQYKELLETDDEPKWYLLMHFDDFKVMDLNLIASCTTRDVMKKVFGDNIFRKESGKE